MKATIGQKVYIKELNEYGTVESLNENGQAKTIKVGARIIKAIDYIIQNASTIVTVIKFLRSLLKK